MTKKMTKIEKPRTMKQLGVQVDVAQWRRFRAFAMSQGRTASEVLKEAIEEYLRKHGSEVEVRLT